MAENVTKMNGGADVTIGNETLSITHAGYKDPHSQVSAGPEGARMAQLESATSSRDGKHTLNKTVLVGFQYPEAEYAKYRDNVVIANATTQSDYDYGMSKYNDGNGSSVIIHSPKVAALVSTATLATLEHGITPESARELDKLRQDVARYGVNDGKFDPEETQKIVSRALKIVSAQAR